MTIRSSYIIIILLAVSMPLLAQKKQRRKKPVKQKRQTVVKQPVKAPSKDSIKGTSIEIVQSYKPEVKQVPKPEFTPHLPPADTTRPVFNYVVPQQSLNYMYRSQPLRPLALDRAPTSQTFPNYLKIGGGNLSTIAADVGIGGLKGVDCETAIHAHHLSQTGNIKNQAITSTGVEAEGKLHTDFNVWKATVDAFKDQYHYYGYDHNLFTYGRDTIRQVFRGLKIGVDMQNEEVTSLFGVEGVNYHPAVQLSLYDAYGASERSFNISLPVSYEVDTTLKLKLGINAMLTQSKLKATQFDNNIVQLTPGVELSKDAVEIRAGLYPTMGLRGFLLPAVFFAASAFSSGTLVFFIMLCSVALALK